jgi:uncharacterized protein (TIGR02231 family)
MNPVKWPVTRVLLMEDRAQVEHQGELSLTAGLQRFQITDLPSVLVDRSLRVEVQGATFVDAAVQRRWKQKPRGGLPADASELRRQIETLEREIRERGDRVSLLNTRAKLLDATRADLLRSIAEQAGHGKADLDTWRTSLNAVSTQQADNDLALRAAEQALAQSEEHQSKAQAVLAQSEHSDQEIETFLNLAVDGGGTAKVTLSYLVPCAMWRPIYRAILLEGRVRLEAEAMVWQHTGQDWRDVALRFSTARPTLGTSPPSLVEDRIVLRYKTQQEKSFVAVALREQAIATTGEQGGQAEMPGLDDGGEARLLAGPERVHIPSDGEPHRVPLFAFETAAETEWQCPAELTPRVFTVARFKNTSGNVLLAGPLELIRRWGYVGRTRLKFSAPGETVKLSFGPEDGLRVVRSVEEKIEEGRLTGRRTRTKTITLRLSNARPDPAQFVVEERIPISEVKEVEIEVLEKQCEPRPQSTTAEGIARLAFQLPAHGTEEATFVWRLSAASKVDGV